MASITIDDLPTNLALDAKAMSSIRGGGAPWVYGWITAYDPEVRNLPPALNFYQTNNSFYADQMNIQFETVKVNNTAPGSNISVALDERSNNSKH
jgi:hypothetical protein